MKIKHLSSTLLSIILLFAITNSLIAQETTQEKVNKKLKELKGEVSKIIIQSEEGEKVFEGDEAEYLHKRLKKNRTMKLDQLVGHEMNIWIDDNDSAKSIEKIIKIDGDRSVFFFDDENSIHEIIIDEIAEIDSLIKEVKVEEKNGNVKITVTSIEDGEEKTESFEGEDAEDKLKKLRINTIKNGENKFLIKRLGKKMKWSDSNDRVIILDNDEHADEMTIKVNVEKNDGDLKVIVEEIEDGETKITEYTGEEAEEYLKSNKDENIFIEKLDGEDLKIVISKAKAKGDKSQVFTWFDDEKDDLATKIVKYKEEDGTEVLTITTIDEDGEKTTEKYEGEEAKEKLKELKEELNIHDIKSTDSKFIIKKKK
jgi:hypothetical protein